jgi:regulator of protease activity HflC (stomatin/prohibitin superfamily)
MDIKFVISAIAAASWLGVVVLLVLTVIRASRRQNIKAYSTGLIIAVVLALILNTVSAGMVFVEPDKRGVVITIRSGGVRSEVLQPGLRWVVPYAESVITYPISRQTYTMSIAHEEGQIAGDDSVAARTSDGQVVKIDASIIFALDPEEVVNVHIKWGNNYVDNLVRPQVRGVIRDAVSQFGVEEVYSTKRLELSQMMNTAMSDKMEEGGLILIDFVLRNITFSDEYAASVEQKQIAEQLAQQAKFVVEQKKQEAEQARQVAQGEADAAVFVAEGQAKAVVIQAEADAEARVIQATAEASALKLIADALRNNPDLLTFEYISKLAPGIKVMLVPSNNPYILPLPDMDLEAAGLSAEPSIIPTTPTNP